MTIHATARSRSDDPSQESLRERKDKWNKSVSKLIAELIALKRGMNGKGDQQVGLPPGSIKDPLPSEVVTYLNFVADDYLNVMREADAIAQQQAGYAQTRRKGRTEMPGAMASLEVNAGIISRFRLHGLSKEERTVRLSMIRYLDNAEHKFHDIDSFLTSSDENSLAQAIIAIVNMGVEFYNVMLVNSIPHFINATDIENKLHTAPKGEMRGRLDVDTSSFITAILDEAEFIDIVYNYLTTSAPLPQALKVHVENNYAMLKNLINGIHNTMMQGVEPSAFSPKLIGEQYRKLLEVANKYIAPARNFAELVAKLPKPDPQQAEAIRRRNEEFEKIAHNVLTRWIKRKWLGVNPTTFDMLKMKTLEKVLEAEKKSDLLLTMLNDKKADPFKLFEEIKNMAALLAEMLRLTLPLVEIRINKQKTIDLPKGEKLISITPSHRKSISDVYRHISRWVEKFGGIRGG